jgi:hypothetical protein
MRLNPTPSDIITFLRVGAVILLGKVMQIKDLRRYIKITDKMVVPAKVASTT